MSFDPICYLSRVPYVIAVNSTSRYHALADFIDAARTKPGDLTLASTTAGMGQLAFEMLKRTADVKMTFVPYAGDAPAVSALLGEHVTSVLFTYAAVAAQVSAGKLRVLATVSPRQATCARHRLASSNRPVTRCADHCRERVW
jgi:tripartite-type tricarboxylate transporter receptor subunit TctC